MQISGRDISMTRGDSESITVSCRDLDGINIPLVTGDTIYFTVKETCSTDTKAFQKIVTTFDDGKAIIKIVPLDTKDLKFKDYFYDIQLTRVDSSVTTIIPPSKFTIDKEVTYE